MKTLIRSLIVVAVFVVALAALRTTTATTPEATPPPSPSVSPSAPPSDEPSEEPSETPDASPKPVGTITIVDGVAVGGPGISLADAIAGDLTQPVLVNGVLFKDTDGALYLAESLTDASTPTFGDLRLRVVGYPEGGAEWDLANAELTGLQEANGILFFEDAQLFGVIEVES